MEMRIDEPIEVEVTESGAPARFIWRGETYGVVSTPEPWVGRREWWRSPTARAPRGSGARLLEVECWRVDAVALSTLAHHPRVPHPALGSSPNPFHASLIDQSYDLTRMPEDGSWRLAAASGSLFDERLFA